MISREKGTVASEGGGLFTREKHWFSESSNFDLYAQVADGTYGAMVESFLTDYLVETGFGADKSLGMGELDITKDKTFDPDLLDAELANSRMALSLTAFPTMGDYPSFYRLKTKFGKLGGEFAISSPTGGDTRPFKKPVLMYEEGAVFVGTTALDAMPLLSDIHSDHRIRHCGIPLTIPLTINEEINYA
jgi:CRISPR-associated protein Csm4